MATNYCRLCADIKSNSDLTNILKDDNSTSVSLNYKIFKCFQINIDDNDELPKYVCSGCCENVSFTYNFYVKIHQTQIFLRSIFSQQENNQIKVVLNSDINHASDCDSKLLTKIENNSSRSDENSNINENLYSANLENNYLPSENFHTEIKIEPENIVENFETTQSDLIEKKNVSTLQQDDRFEEKQYYKCKICSRTFNYSNHLRQHQRIHSVSEEKMSSSDIEDNVEPVIPEKSRAKYKLAYDKYEKWCDENNIRNSTSEKVLLLYFGELSKIQKPTSLWCCFSMLRTEILIEKKVDIKKHTNLLALLKNKSQGYRPKKSRMFTRENVVKFLRNANDKRFLWIKVVLIFGLAGACRREELAYLQRENVIDEGVCFRILIPNSKKQIYREFFITSGNIDGLNLVDIVRQYLKLRPEPCDNNRFFLAIRNGKCTKQPIGINTIGNVPKLIAQFLDLPYPKEYTGHCFRKSSTILLRFNPFGAIATSDRDLSNKTANC